MHCKQFLLVFLSLVLVACGNNNQVRYVDADPTEVNVIRKNMSNKQQTLYDEALTAIENKDYRDAIKRLESITKQNDTLAEVYLNLALAHYQLEAFANSESAAQRAVQLDPGSPNTQYMLGLASLQTNQIETARTALEKAIEYDNEHAYAHYNLALIYDIYYQQLQSAIDHYQRYVLLVDEDDTETRDWIEQLKGSL